MPPTNSQDVTEILRDSIAALSERLSTDFGELVPEASIERTAQLVNRIDRPPQEDLETLDSWIRLADNAVLHDDSAEARRRVEIARQLREVRAFVAPVSVTLKEDPR